MTPSQRELVRKIFRTIVVLGLALICAVPLYYVIVSSFKTSIDMIKNPLGLPEQWTLENYKEAFADGTIIRAFVNTLIVTVVAVLLQVLVGSMAAFGVVYKKSKFTAIVGGVLMVTFAIPVQATMLPLYRMESETGLVDSLLGLIVLYMGSCVFCYFLIVGYMKSPATGIVRSGQNRRCRPMAHLLAHRVAADHPNIDHRRRIPNHGHLERLPPAECVPQLHG